MFPLTYYNHPRKRFLIYNQKKIPLEWRATLKFSSKSKSLKKLNGEQIPILPFRKESKAGSVELTGLFLLKISVMKQCTETSLYRFQDGISHWEKRTSATSQSPDQDGFCMDSQRIVSFINNPRKSCMRVKHECQNFLQTLSCSDKKLLLLRKTKDTSKILLTEGIWSSCSQIRCNQSERCGKTQATEYFQHIFRAGNVCNAKDIIVAAGK